MRDTKAHRGGIAVAVTTVASALALAAPAAAKTLDFQGPIGPSGAISFTVKGTKSKAKVVDLKWYRLPVDCGGSDDTSTGALSYSVPLKQGKFSADAVLGNPNHPKAEAIITGKVNGKKSHGTILVRGSKLPIAGGTGDCESGKHPWNAAG
jgi:hypothetical protein